jgi:hypothetical protein
MTGEGVQLVALDHLHGRSQALFHPLGKGLAGIAAIDQHTLDALQVGGATVECDQRACAVGHIGGGDRDGMGQPMGIGRYAV